VEEVAVVVLQVFFELGIQLLGAPGIDFSTNSPNRTDRGCGWVVLHTFLGGDGTCLTYRHYRRFESCRGVLGRV